MKATMYNSANTAASSDILKRLVVWINSAAGQSAVNTAIETSVSVANKVVESRKISVEQLHEPITL